MTFCLHKNHHITFSEAGEKWYVCDDCGQFIYPSELDIYTRMAAMVELLQKTLDDSKVGVVPKNHLDRIASTLEEYE